MLALIGVYETANTPPLSIPATATSETARSTDFRPSLTESVAVLCWTTEMEKKRGDERAMGDLIVVRRRGVVLERKDIVYS